MKRFEGYNLIALVTIYVCICCLLVMQKYIPKCYLYSI